MADLNNFAFTGRCTQDAVIRDLASGKKVLSVNVAVNTGYGDYKKTLFIKVQMWGDRGDNGCQRSRKVHAAPDSRNAVHSGFGQSEHRRHGRTLAQGRGAVCLQGKENRLRVPVPSPASGVYCPGECNDACAYCRTGGEGRQEKGRGAPGRARAGGKGGTQALAAFRRRAAEGCHSQGSDQ